MPNWKGKKKIPPVNTQKKREWRGNYLPVKGLAKKQTNPLFKKENDRSNIIFCDPGPRNNQCPRHPAPSLLTWSTNPLYELPDGFCTAWRGKVQGALQTQGYEWQVSVHQPAKFRLGVIPRPLSTTLPATVLKDWSGSFLYFRSLSKDWVGRVYLTRSTAAAEVTPSIHLHDLPFTKHAHFHTELHSRHRVRGTSPSPAQLSKDKDGPHYVYPPPCWAVLGNQ